MSSLFQKVTFGEFKKFTKNEDFKEDRENFLDSKKTLLSYLLFEETNFDKLTEEQISDLDNLIDEQLEEVDSINENENSRVYFAFYFFMFKFGLSLDLLSGEEKEELLTMDLSYKNCKIMFSNIFDKYIEKMESLWPDEIKICYKERGFISYCHNREKIRIKKDNNFLMLIRDYFLLDQGKIYYEKCRDNNLFNEIKNELKALYPVWKEKYGRNKYLDKFLGFMGYGPSDYCYEEVSKILNDYDEQKKQKNIGEYIPIKYKED